MMYCTLLNVVIQLLILDIQVQTKASTFQQVLMLHFFIMVLNFLSSTKQRR